MKNRLFNLSNMLLSGVLSLLGFGSCNFVRNENVECVYGPPPDYYDKEPVEDDTLQASQTDTLQASQTDTQEELHLKMSYDAVEALIYNENEKPKK